MKEASSSGPGADGDGAFDPLGLPLEALEVEVGELALQAAGGRGEGDGPGEDDQHRGEQDWVAPMNLARMPVRTTRAPPAGAGPGSGPGPGLERPEHPAAGVYWKIETSIPEAMMPIRSMNDCL